VTLHEFVFPEDKTARRITLLHEVPTSESEDGNEIPSVPADSDSLRRGWVKSD
jgi:hypothetical protein